MLDLIDRQRSLTRNQIKLIGFVIAGNMLDFFDLFLIGFVLSFIVRPWGLSFGESATVLLSSGVGATLGAIFWGALADRVGRRFVFCATIANFALATGAMALTRDGAWVYLAVMRFFVGFGAGGLYCVDVPLVLEFVPGRFRGRIGGLVTVSIPVGLLLASLATATLSPSIGWRGLFLVGAAPAFLLLLVRAWIPESPRWLLLRGNLEMARRSVAWALGVSPESLPQNTGSSNPTGQITTRVRDLLHYPRSLLVSWITNLGAQTGHYGFTMWAPTLLVLVLQISPVSAAWYVAAISLGGLAGRFLFSWLADRIGRRRSGLLLGFGSASTLLLAATLPGVYVGPLSAFWLTLIVANVFIDGGFAVVGPYAAEVWPSWLRATGMGSAYGFGGIGKIIGPLGLAWIVGSSNVVTPQATIAAIGPSFLYLAVWFAIVAVAFMLLGIETRGRSIQALDDRLLGEQAFPRVRVGFAPVDETVSDRRA
jgi:MFS transporter, putative metabolite:H+ symporter